MVIIVDLNSETPIYIQLQNQIIKAIAKSELKCGDTLPSVRQLASDLGVNLHTVNKAYNNLKQEGFLTVNRRKGVNVNAKEVYQANEEYLKALDEEMDILVTKAIVRGISAEELEEKIRKIYESVGE